MKSSFVIASIFFFFALVFSSKDAYGGKATLFQGISFPLFYFESKFYDSVSKYEKFSIFKEEILSSAKKNCNKIVQSPFHLAKSPLCSEEKAHITIDSKQSEKKEEKKSYSFDPTFLPRIVEYSSEYEPGTIMIDSSKKFLYFVEGEGKARRYGIGVGRHNMAWTGIEIVSRKVEWPDWRPPLEMIQRERQKGKKLPPFVPGGLSNPLGARAIYLGSTLYRIHGTNAPWTIGKNVSSGCIRMRNEDVKDLYQRVRIGAKVVVM